MPQGMNDDIAVTVVCIAYNHAPYIRSALDSIVRQKTSFKYKVLVHDDASTDGTAEIIKEYADRYPSLIVPILQTKNLFSQGILPSVFVAPYIEGKYVALCECDDWWDNDYKLQMQWDYMESHKSCSLCTHAVDEFLEPEHRVIGQIAPSDFDRDYSVDEVILGDGGMFGTNSMFFRSEYYELPSCYLGWGVGDYPRTVYLATQGEVHYVAKVMSTYRIGSLGSWTTRMQGTSFSVSQKELIIRGLKEADKYTDGLYHASFERRVALTTIDLAGIRGDWGLVNQPSCQEAFKALPLRRKIKIFLECKAPFLAGAINKVWITVKRKPSI